MAAAQVVDARVNPNNPDQRIILWGNGRIDVRNAAPVTDGPTGWFTRIDQPVAVAIWVIDWNAMSGYVLDKQGGFHAFGGASTVTIGGDNGAVVPGVPYWNEGIYLDWSFDPNNPGRGVVLDGYGTLHAFGGAPTPPRVGHRWVNPSIAARLEMQWGPGSEIRAYTLDRFGGIHADYAASAAPTSPEPPYWPGWQAARHLAITKWTTPAAGYTLDLFGAPLAWGGAPKVTSWSPYNSSGDWARVMRVLSASNPTRIWEVWAGGQEFEIVASTPPTVTAGGLVNVSPASTVTGTTRPMLQWDYSDPQRDSQAAFEWMVFTAAFVASHNMTDPFVHWQSAVAGGNGTDPLVRGVGCPIDLPNGGYRLYVRAQDTAGQWSAWSSRNWTQNVPLPATPTGLTATVDPQTATVALTATTTAGGTGTLLRFERSDDDGATWAAVDGADALPRAATTAAVDRFPPQGVTVSYRAVRYSDDPRVASLPSAVATADVPVVGHLLHAADNPTLGGRITVQEPLDWVRTSTAGVFQGLDADYPTVVKDGSRPRAARATLNLLSLDAATWSMVENLALSRDTLVYRGPFGDVRYCEIVGDWGQEQVRAAPTRAENTPLRHMHTTGLPVVEVRPPHLAA